MRFRQPWFAVAAAAVASATAATAAPKVAEYPDAVGAFERACLSGELTVSAFGISGKSVDLPHHIEWAGRAGVGKNPVCGEIFTRSQVFGGYRDMHMYVAF